MKKYKLWLLGVLCLLLTAFCLVSCDAPVNTPDGENDDSDNASAEVPVETPVPPLDEEPDDKPGESVQPPDNDIVEHHHSYTEVITSPTCEKEGYTTYTCHCGDTYKDNVQDPLQHDIEQKNMLSPTCTTDGLTEEMYCVRCETILRPADIIPALGHVEVIDAAVEATCTADGKTEGKHCSVCYDVLAEQISIPANGHTEIYINGVPATCEQDGLTVGVQCSVCSHILSAQVKIEAPGHDRISHAGKNATCTEDGWNDYVTCSRCNFTTKSIIAANGHTEVVDEAVAVTCTTNGKTAGTHCFVCQEVLTAQQTITATGHTKTVLPQRLPTCTTEGLTEGEYCTVCSEILTAQTRIEKLPHTPETLNGFPASCTEYGCTDGEQCSVCFTVLVPQELLEPLGHKEAVISAEVPTCVSYGWTEGKYCPLCYTTLVEQQSIDPLGHTEVTVDKVAATCTTDGKTEGKRCSVCHATLIHQNRIPALGHDSVYHEGKKGTCIELGWYDYTTCTRCDYSTRATYYGEHAHLESVCTVCSDILYPVHSYRKINNGTAYEIVQGTSGYYGTNGVIYIPSTYDNLPVVSIADKAFQRNSGLRRIIIPDSITSIGAQAFESCENLKEVVFGNGLQTIGNYAFSSCFALRNVTIPDSVTNMGAGTFRSCIGLTSVIIGNGVKTIGVQTFNYCTELTNVTMGTDVEIIDESAFASCEKLKNIVLPEKLTTIRLNAFSGCTHLTYIVIPQKVTSLSSGAFYTCPRLTEVVNLSDMTITESFFDSSLKTRIKVLSSVPTTGHFLEKDGYLFYIDTDGTVLVDYTGNESVLTLPADVGGASYEIGPYAFYRCMDLEEIRMTGGITSIGYGAFLGCENLQRLIFSEGITTIAEDSVSYCNKLLEVTLPSTLTTIEPYAFHQTALLPSITIPENVTEIGKYAFLNCNNLMEVHNQSALTLTPGSTSNGYLAFYAKTIITDKADTHFIKKDGYVFYQQGAYYTLVSYEGKEKHLVLPDDILGSSYTVGVRAFANHDELLSVVISDGVTAIGDYAFENCYGLTQITIGKNVTSVGFAIFPLQSRLREVINLSSVTVSEYNNITVITDETKSGLFEKDGFLFYAYGPETKLYYLVYYTGTETNLVLPSEINGHPYYINDFAFYGNKTLTSILISEGVNEIAQCAFQNCTNLQKIIFEKTPDKQSLPIDFGYFIIGVKVFDKCTSLTEIYYLGTKVEWNLLNVEENNGCFFNAAVYYYSETEPPLDEDGTAYAGNYWHYGENKEIVVWTNP